MKILIITNISHEFLFETIWIADSFKQDGHEVSLVDVDYSEKFDSIYDVFIKRNTWNLDKTKIFDYQNKLNEVTKRVIDKDLPRINFDGKFDTLGKRYLLDLFNKGYPVIPTINNLRDIEKLPKTDKYLLKPLDSYNGIGQIKVLKDDIVDKFTADYIIQPIMLFVSEIQFYFIGTDFQYALEFKPSKVPVYPEAIEYNYSEKELNIACEFAAMNKNFYGIQRIDFIKLLNGDILLLEIEDSSPYLDLDRVSAEIRETFLNNYKNMIYKYFENSEY